MNEMPLNTLKEHIEVAQTWASEMSEVWTNTLVGDFIDREKEVLENAVNAQDWDEAYKSMVDLVHLCNDAEERGQND
jgi:hypothetical protein